MCVNCDKTKELIVFLWHIPAITIEEKTIERVTSTKLLGVIIRNDLEWSPHITMIHGKAAQRLCLLKWAGVECIHIIRIYVSRVCSLLDYACQVQHIGLTVLDSDKLEGIQKRAMTVAFPELSYECAVNRANINTIHTRRGELYRRSVRGRSLAFSRVLSHDFKNKNKFTALRARTKR